MAAIFLAILLGISLSVYEGLDHINYNYSGYFWLVPTGAFAAYFWFIIKYVMNQIDQKMSGPWSVIGSLLITLLILILGYQFAPETVQQKLTAWPMLALILAPLFAAIGIGVSFFTPDRQSFDRWLHRACLAFLTLTIVAVDDLSEYLNRYEPVKKALLEQSLISSTLIKGLQPLFDSDGDGTARAQDERSSRSGRDRSPS